VASVQRWQGVIRIVKQIHPAVL